MPWMILAPLLRADHILRTTKVGPVRRLAEPTLLAGRFAGLAAFRLGTVLLPLTVSMVRGEVITT